MDGPIAGATVFACLFSSALAGVLLVLLTLSQKAAFDSADRDVKRFSSELIALDSTLRRAGPQAEPARELLFRYAVHDIQVIWPDSSMVQPRRDTVGPAPLGRLEDAIAALGQPAGDPARADLVRDARRLLHEASQTSWSLESRANASTSPYLVGVVLFWLMLTFASFGLSAPPARAGGNTLVLTVLFLGAVALGGAMFLLQEYNDPFRGVITVSHEPLQAALFAISE